VILWRNLHKPGHEAARLIRAGSDWRLEGASLFLHEAKPVRLDYVILCDDRFHTRSADVSGWIGDQAVASTIKTESGDWTLNGQRVHAVKGCVDVDLNFSPSTNLLPIRRLNLKVGQKATVKAAWLRFPSFTFETLHQTYERVADRKYRYESGGGRFTAMLNIDGDGFVTNYGELFTTESGS
jgi:hypothetical protein